MPEFHLEFEKPVIELKKKIEELKNFSEHNSIDVSEQIDALTVRLNEMIKEIYTSLTPWQRVQLARHPERPYTLDYIEHLFTNFIELSGDRRFRDDKAIVGGFAKFRGKPVMVIGTQKGRDMKSNVYRNFGWPSPEGYRKAMRLMQLAEKAEVPIITFIDTPEPSRASPAKSATSPKRSRSICATCSACGFRSSPSSSAKAAPAVRSASASATASSSWRTPTTR